MKKYLQGILLGCLGIAIPIITYQLWSSEIPKENNTGENWTAGLLLFLIASFSFKEIRSFKEILHRKIQCLTVGFLLSCGIISLVGSSKDNFFYFGLLGYLAGMVLGIIFNPHFFRSKHQT